MNDELNGMLTEVLTDRCPPALVEASEGGWSEDLWKVLESVGLTAVGIPEEQGGSGGGFDDAVAVVRAAARFAAPVPLMQTLLVAPMLRDMFGLPHRAGPTAVAWTPVRAAAQGERWRLTGTVSDVSYAPAASSVLLLGVGDAGRIVLAEVDASLEWALRTDLAGEPRGTAAIDVVVPAATTDLDLTGVLDLARDAEALALVWGMVGALEKIEELTVGYVTAREQFGRPIAKFQAVKQLAAQIAGAVAIARAAAIEATAARGRPDAAFAVAAARARTAGAGTDAARYAHQLHGAIGFTREYPLHHYTRRIWAWRDEGRSAVVWTELAGRRALAGGGAKLWETIVG
ncbi:acyl-CoA/acyl-ACP dehydrogenase [Actinomadura madurae]|uniref:acyl-CoA dehydrogenase family protein n=1 Tax=Actinomadura madurae TaxID=1993 RepID=UPI003999F4F6